MYQFLHPQTTVTQPDNQETPKTWRGAHWAPQPN